MCFSNSWCSSVCFSGVERQMQLRVWMSKAFSGAFREVFKVGTILCWYYSSSFKFFFTPCATCVFFLRAGFNWLWTRRGYIFVFHIAYALIYLVVFAYFFSFVTGLLSASEDLWCGGWSIGGQWLCCAGFCALLWMDARISAVVRAHMWIVRVKASGRCPGESRGMPRDCKYSYYRVIWIPIM